MENQERNLALSNTLEAIYRKFIKKIGVRLIVMGAGAAVGTAIKPGTGTTIALLATDYLVTPIASGMVDNVLGGNNLNMHEEKNAHGARV